MGKRCTYYLLFLSNKTIGKGKEKMNNLIIKTKTFALIITVLMIASAMIIAAPIQPVKAQYQNGNPKATYTGGPLPSGVTPDATVETIPYISVSPNPIGVGQQVLVNLWVQPALQMNRAHTTYTVIFTKPDGTSDTVGPINSYTADTTAWFNYLVDQEGTWKIQFNFDGDYYPAGYYYNGIVYPSLAAIGPYTVSAFGGPALLGSAYYKPSSTSVNLTVQSTPVMSWPVSALPTDYWTRPVSPMNREWREILGDYPYIGYMSNPPANTNPYASNYKFTPYVQAPNTCHIVWARQGAQAGIMGGDAGQKTLGSGEGTYAGTPNIIFEGRCYQTVTKPMMQLINGTYQSWPTSVWECYDLRTGQIYWDLTGVTAPTAITYITGVVAVPGATATQTGTSANLVAISGGRLIRYSPETGAATLNVSTSPITSGTIYRDPYVLSVQTLGSGASTTYRLINWTMAGSDTDFNVRIMSNITWPFSSLGTCDFQSGVAVTTLSYSPSATAVATMVYIQGASLTTGKLMWNVSSNVGYPLFSGSTACADRGKYAVRFDNGYWYCWDLQSGNQLWKSEQEKMPWGTFGTYNEASAYGLLFDFTYAGIYTLDWNTGKITWHFDAPCLPFESPWYPDMAFFGTNPQIADGKLYVANGEHSPTSPLARGWKLYCVNATTGEEIWNISSRANVGGIEDGYLTADSVYTGYMYVIGKGQSATTVTAPDTAVSTGTAIEIRGNVMDMSQGDQGTFTNPTAPPDSVTKPGMVPCVSADSMETEMEYRYMQFPIDGSYHNVTMTGVPVTLTAIASDGTVTEIGTVTTNAYYGTFSQTWTPQTTGDYKIIASFTGDDSYGSSGAATALTVAQAPTATTTAAPVQSAPDNTMVIIASALAVIIAIAIVGALMMLTFKKRR